MVATATTCWQSLAAARAKAPAPRSTTTLDSFRPRARSSARSSLRSPPALYSYAATPPRRQHRGALRRRGRSRQEPRRADPSGPPPPHRVLAVRPCTPWECCRRDTLSVSWGSSVRSREPPDDHRIVRQRALPDCAGAFVNPFPVTPLILHAMRSGHACRTTSSDPKGWHLDWNHAVRVHARGWIVIQWNAGRWRRPLVVWRARVGAIPRVPGVANAHDSAASKHGVGWPKALEQAQMSQGDPARGLVTALAHYAPLPSHEAMEPWSPAECVSSPARARR